MDEYSTAIQPDTPPVAPPRFNQNIAVGPTISDLPNPVQPPTGSPSFNSAGFISEAFRRLPPDVAMKAMEGAIQLEGLLGYDADVKAGVPSPAALAKWAPKLWHRNPAAVAKLTQEPFNPTTRDVGGHQLIQTSPNRFQLAPQGIPTGPVEAQEVMGPGGTPLTGVTAIRGRSGSVHVIPEKAQGPNPTQLGMLIKHQLDDIGLQLRDVGAEGGIPENSPEHKALLEDQKRYRGELRRVTDQVIAPKSSAVTAAHPKIGEIRKGYRFKGGDPHKKESWEKS